MRPAELWPSIDALIRAHRAEDLRDLLAALDDADRKECVAPLKAFARPGRDELPPWDYFGGIAMTGAAVLPDARSVASWLRRHDARDLVRGVRPQEVSLHSLVGDILVARDPRWLEGVVRLWGETFRANEYQPEPFQLLERLRAHTDAAPPSSQGYVGAWVFFEWLNRARYVGIDPVERVTADPRFAALVPLVPEVDDVAWALENSPSTFPRVVDADAVDRDQVLDAILARLQRGGRPGHLKSWVAVWTQLSPTSDELASRAEDLIALLPSTSAAVVKLAQKSLFRLDDEHRLRAGHLLEVGRILLPRTEKKIVRDTLARLRRHAVAHPERVGEVASAVTAGLSSPAIDLQRDSANALVALGDAGELGDDALADVRRGVADLPVDLRPVLEPLAGTRAEPVHAPASGQVLHVPSPPVAIDPIGGHAELIEELLALVRAEGNKMGGIALERVIEAIPRLVAAPSTAGEQAREAALVVLHDPEFAWIHRRADFGNHSVRRGLFALLSAAAGTPLATSVDRFPSRERPPQRVLSRRLFALAATLSVNPAVRTVALPTYAGGSILAVDLLARLRHAADSGWEPESVDLEQALLRTSPVAESAVREQLAGLGSAAGTRAAYWLSGNAPSVPTTTLKPVKEYRDTQYDHARSGPPPPDSYISMPTFDPDGVTSDGTILWSMLVNIAYPPSGFIASWDPEAAYEAWPLVLPHHREIIAAHVVPDMTRGRTATSQADVALSALAHNDGAVGPALLTACVHAAAAKAADNRAAGIDALLILAARRQLEPSIFAGVLLQLLTGRDVSIKRLAPALMDIANGGAAAHLTPALLLLVDKLLTESAPAVTGLADLLSVTAHAALLAPDALSEVPTLTAFASKRGSSRQLVEARRLRDLLTSP